MILIITNPTDEHADLVCTHLDREKVKYVRLHPESLRKDFTITYTPGRWLLTRLEPNVDADRLLQPLDLSTVRAIWFRRPQPVELPTDCSPEETDFARKEWQHILKCLYQNLKGRKWLNDPEQIGRAEMKLDQLDVAASLGLRAPRTIVTNDPVEALAFLDAMPGEIIYKQMSGYFYLDRKGGGGYAIYTNVISRQDLLDRSDAIRLAPCQFQEYIQKAKELRITIVGQKIFATEIDSQASQRSKVDWRHYDIANTPYSSTEIPVSVAQKLLAFLAHYSLSFGCIDMILTPDGEYVFLELNPNGQWQWVEILTGQPISQEIAAYLTAK